MTNLKRLTALLTNSKLQQQDIALYNVIKQLIEAAQDNQDGLQKQLDALNLQINGSGNPPSPFGILGQDFLTASQDKSVLPNARKLIAGNNVNFDDATRNERIINVNAQSGVPPIFFGDDGRDDGLLIPGPQGIQGVIGPTGATGASGNGNIGPPGLDGYNGEDALMIPGAVGPTGAAGPSSISGATVVTSESTNSTSYTNLSTTGPTLTIVMNGTIAIIWLTAQIQRNGTGNTGLISVAVSSASTVAASDNTSASGVSAIINTSVNIAAVVVLTGLTPGSNVFTMKYRVDGNSYNFFNRGMAVYAP